MDSRSNLNKWLQKQIAIFLPKYINHRNHINKGNGEFTFLRHPIQAVLLAKIAYTWLPTWACVLFVIGYLILCKGFGWFWDKNKGYDEEIEWSNNRNPTIQHIKRKV